MQIWSPDPKRFKCKYNWKTLTIQENREILMNIYIFRLLLKQKENYLGIFLF